MKKYFLTLTFIIFFLANNIQSEAKELYVEDTLACFLLVNMSISFSQEELNENRNTIEIMINQINIFPNDKKEYLRKATITYIYYKLSSLYDLNDYNIDYIIDASEKYQVSERTKMLQAKLQKYSAAGKFIELYSTPIKNEMSKFPTDKKYDQLPKDKQIEIMTNTAMQEESIVTVQQRTSRMYQTMFRQRFPKPEWARLEWVP